MIQRIFKHLVLFSSQIPYPSQDDPKDPESPGQDIKYDPEDTQKRRKISGFVLYPAEYPESPGQNIKDDPEDPETPGIFQNVFLPCSGRSLGSWKVCLGY